MTKTSRWSARAPAAEALVLVGLVAACASGGQPNRLPPQTVTDPRLAAISDDPALRGVDLAPPEPTGSVANTTSATEQAHDDSSDRQASSDTAGARAPESDPTLIVIGQSDAEGRGDSRALLRKASRGEQERRERSGKPALVLTDENLAEKAEGGRLTLGAPTVAPAEDTGAATSAADGNNVTAEDPLLASMTEDERYWRTRVLDVRRRWRQAFDDIPRLESEVERLRTAFYSEDDPARRDRQIKPLWDRALDRLRDTQDELTRAPEELGIVLAEGHSAGAQPGWLREGIELEPPLPPGEQDELVIDENDPGEPVIAEPAKDPPPSL